MMAPGAIPTLCTIKTDLRKRSFAGVFYRSCQRVGEADLVLRMCQALSSLKWSPTRASERKCHDFRGLTVEGGIQPPCDRSTKRGRGPKGRVAPSAHRSQARRLPDWGENSIRSGRERSEPRAISGLSSHFRRPTPAYYSIKRTMSDNSNLSDINF